MRRHSPVLLSILAVVLCVSRAHALPPDFTDTVVYTGFDQPTAMIFAPDGRMFVGERTGAVRVIEDGIVQPTPVITLPVENFEEQGLLGLELHPDFPDSNWLYVAYTRFTGRNNENFTLISRFLLVGNVADPVTEQILLDDMPTGHGYHVAGDIHFAPDKTLYITNGENGWGEIYPRQNDRLEGKLLRINAWGGAAPGNPLIGVSGARPEIWQKGFRNPFRFTIDPVYGRVYVCDVGEVDYEEIDTGSANADFGFPTYEGPVSPNPSWHTNPWYSYPHDFGAALTGAAIYRSDVFPFEYWGNLFFMDHVRGEIGRIQIHANGSILGVTFPWGTTSVSGWLSGPISLVCGPDGALWYNTYDPGDIHRVAYQPPAGVEPGLRAFELAPAMPNPFSSRTTMVFSLASAGRADLALFDLSGRRVRTLATGELAAGPHSASWDGLGDDGRPAPAGLYFARLDTPAGSVTQRVVRAR